MKINIGRLDQILRIGISLVLIYIGFVDETIVPDTLSANIIGTIGVINLVIAIIRFCPLYVVTGINTCQNKEP